MLYFRWVTLFLVITVVSCQDRSSTLSPPDDNPYRLRAGKYTPGLNGEVRDSTGLWDPKVEPPVWLSVNMKPPTYTSIEALERIDAQPQRMPLPTVGDTLPMELIRVIPDTGEVMQGTWPQWREVEMQWPRDTRLPFAQLTTEDGLRGDEINNLVHDRQGRLWISTFGGGVSVYDGQRLMNFGHDEGVDYPFFMGVLEDQSGNIWMQSWNGGVFRWNGYELRRFFADSLFTQDGITHMEADQNGNIWISTYWGKLVCLGDNKFEVFHIGDFRGVAMLNDAQGRFWYGAGKKLFRKEGRFLVEYHLRSPLDSIEIHSLFEDREGRIWIGSDQGLWVWGEDELWLFNEENGFPANEIESIFQDQQGRIWIGMGETGESCLRWDGESWIRIGVDDGLLHGAWDITEDPSGGLWFGSSAGLFYLPPKISFRVDSDHGLDEGKVVDLMEADDGAIWIATQEQGGKGGGISRWDGSRLAYYGVEQGLLYPEIKSVIQDRKGQIWATGADQLLRYTAGKWFVVKKETGGFYRGGLQLRLGPDGEILHASNLGVLQGDEHSLTHWFIRAGLNWLDIASVVKDRHGRTWMGTIGRGINLHDPELYGGQGGFRYINESEGLASNYVNDCLLEDQAGNIWIGSPNRGLTVWDGEGFTQYGSEQGLSGDNISALYEAPDGLLYVATEEGMDRLHPDEEGWWVEPYLTAEELRGNRIHSILQDRQGLLWLGGSAGLDIMDLNTGLADTLAPHLVWRGLMLGGERIDWRQPDDSLSSVQYDSIYANSNVPHAPSFPYYQNYLTFQWSGIHWAAPDRVRYKYLLEGQDQAWSTSTAESEITFTNLDPGNYTLHVRAIGKSGKWSETLSYSFVIRFPWWQTWWAYALYLGTFLVVVWSIYRYELRRRLFRNEAQRLQELDQVKTRLFTNITHELRTPLSIIKGWAENIREKPAEWGRTGANLIEQNTNRLEELVNQMLDLARLDAGQLSLNLEGGDLNEWIAIQVDALQGLAEQHDITLVMEQDEEPIRMDFDHERVAQIINNLVSNAIKFTDPGGEVTVGLKTYNKKVCLKVTDTGIGIPADALPHVFDRFRQVDDSSTRRGEGTGIGLALVSELVDLMEGEVEVESKEGQGSTFSVWLPLRHELPISEVQTPDLPSLNDHEAVIPTPILKPDDRPHLLLIEDNEDLIKLLQVSLQDTYQLSLAKDGVEGLEKAFEMVPDLVVTDVMMPRKDGFEVCHELKNNVATSHVPVIMLTAKVTAEDRITGLLRGADAYLTKPVVKKELLLQIRNQLAVRKELQARYRSQDMQIQPGNSPDLPQEEVAIEDAFVQKARQLVLDHLEDTNLNVEVLTRELGLSRPSLHRKLKALTNKSTTEFIRAVRLSQAVEYLKNEQLDIAEIAYKVGFDPAYFSNRFREAYGVSPGEYRKNHQGSTG